MDFQFGFSVQLHTPAGCFFSLHFLEFGIPHFQKPLLLIPEQVRHLENRDMNIAVDDKAFFGNYISRLTIP